ncbi:OmpA family protein [Rivibacter subsaxonicus]|uniref:OmpA family protein n=1 Tax=Rivibacter subsaxonicus TaxID=457575 RepID=UPI0013EE59E1|nr:OmpA family protein [Rivibacter subsaxonicus]
MFLLLVAALVVGCATPPAPSPGAPTAPTRPAASGLSPALEAQRLRLTDALAGTPVLVVATDAGQLLVEVPLKFAFDAGRATVKPPLAAVLDQLATGYKPQAQLTELRINAPADDKAATALALQRAQGVRDHLATRGVPANRVVGLGRVERPVVEILISDRPR